MTYTTPVAAGVLGPRTSPCVETWACPARTDGGWTASASVATPGVPCGSVFRVRLQWAATKADAGRTRLRVAARVVFTSPPSIPGVRRVIQSAALDGLRRAYGGYRAALAARFGAGAVDALPPGGQTVTTPPATRAAFVLAVAAVVLLFALLAVGLRREAALLAEVRALRAAVGGREL